MSNTSNFFDKKKEWSKVKDELLSCYFTPYVAKILHTKNDKASPRNISLKKTDLQAVLKNWRDT